VRIAAVGPATAAAVTRQLEVEVSYVPERYAAEEVAAGLEPVRGTRILLPQADRADPTLAEELRGRGAHVDAVTAYRIVEYDHPQSVLAELRRADAVVLMSGTAARSLARQGGAGDTLIACIGPKTAATARSVGLEVGLVAREATAEGIIHALESHFGESQ
jgi:uroporphyrinogen-III synthase